jgi:hypothetical protein
MSESTYYNGVKIKNYLDDETKRVLKDKDYAQANWLVNIGKSVNSCPPSNENIKMEKLLAKLKSAQAAYLDIAKNNQYRIDEMIGLTYFNEAIKNTQQALLEPLPKKSKLENLYQAFRTCLTQEERDKINNRDDCYFLKFMCAVIRLVEDDTASLVEDHFDKVKKQYQRVVLDDLKLRDKKQSK